MKKILNTRGLSFVLLSLGFVTSSWATDVPGGNINSNTTWSLAGSPYIIKGNVTVQNGATLTIDPGVQVRFENAYAITIGGPVTQGTLIAQGNAASHITFTTTASFTGNWNYLHFSNNAGPNSVLEYCDLNKGGNSLGTIYCSSSSPILSHLTITNSNTSGMYLQSSNPSISTVSISGGTNDGIFLSSSSPSLTGVVSLSSNSNYLVYASGTDSVPLFRGATLSSSGKLGKGGAQFWSNLFASDPIVTGGPFEAEVLADALASNATWGGVNWLSSIRLLGSLNIGDASTPTLTIAAGTQVKLDQSAFIYVGNGQPGKLIGAGTSGSHVNFTATIPAQRWGYIYFAAASTGSSLNYCDLSNGGYSTAMIYCASASPQLSNVSVSNSASDGIYLQSSGATLSNVTISNFGTSGSGITFASSSSASFSGSNSIIGPGGTGLFFTSSSPSISGVSISNVSNYALESNDPTSAPTFTGLTISSAAKLAVGGADFWANVFSANPTINGGPYQAEVLGSTLSKNSTWGGVSWLSSIRLLGSLNISGASAPTLTIAAGTNVKLDQSAFIYVGNGQPGKLIGAGTSGSHVNFTATIPAQRWGYIYFAAASTGSSLNYCDLSNGGYSQAMIYCASASPQLSNVSASNSASDGIYLQSSAATLSNISISNFGTNGNGITFSSSSSASLSGSNSIVGPGGRGILFTSSSPSISGVSISGVSGYALEAPDASSAPSFAFLSISNVGKIGKGPADFWANLFAANPTVFGGSYQAEVIYSTLTKDATWGGVNWLSSIRILGSVTIAAASSPVLTVAPGTILKFDQFQFLNVGTSGQSGKLLAVGTNNNRITMTATNPAEPWGYIDFGSQAVAGSTLNYCNLSYGGYATATIYCQSASPQLSNLTISNSSSNGIYLVNSGANLSNISVSNFGTNGTGVLFNSSSSASLSGSNTITGPGETGLYFGASSPSISGVTISGVSSYALEAADGSSAPSLASLSIFNVGKAAVGPADFWANLFASNPTVLGGFYQAEIISSTLTKDSTWGGVSWLSSLRLLGTINVGDSSSPLLTIAPGTALQFDPFAFLNVGNSGQPGKLFAIGTNTNRIRFTASSLSQAWGGVVFGASAIADSELRYCDLENGGYAGAAISCSGLGVVLSNLSIANHNGSGVGISINSSNGNFPLRFLNIQNCSYGVQVGGSPAVVNVSDSFFSNINSTAIDGSVQSIQNCIFQGVGQGISLPSYKAILIDNCQFTNWSQAAIDAAAESFPVITNSHFTGGNSILKLPASAVELLSDPSTGNVFTPTGNAEIGVYGDTIEQETTWSPLANVPFHLLGSINYQKRWTIRAGASLRMEQFARLNAFGAPLPQLIVQGTPAAPVLFTSALSTPAPGNWQGMTLGPGSQLDYATFEYQGYPNTGGLTLSENSTLRHCIIRNSTGIGLQQNTASTMSTPSWIEDCTISGHASDGIRASANTKMNLLRVSSQQNGGYGLKALGTTSPTGSWVDLRESAIVGNKAGGVNAESAARVDAAYCWWGHSSGPSGNGPGSGSSITGATSTSFNPWFATALPAEFRLNEPFVNPMAIPPAVGSVRFFALPNADSNWKIEAFNASNVKVLDWSGSSEPIEFTWRGTQLFGSQAPPPSDPPIGGGHGQIRDISARPIPQEIEHLTPLPNGNYSFTMTANRAAAPATQSILKGTINLNSSLLLCKILNPESMSFLEAGNSFTVTGKAGGTQFQSYTLEYGIGSEPASFTTIASSTTPVPNGTLGVFTPPASSNGYLTLRLRVKNVANQESSDTILVKLFSFSNITASPSPFSPNADGYQDEIAFSANLSWPSQWLVRVYQNHSGLIWSQSGEGNQIQAAWDGRNGSGEFVANGNYNYRITAIALENSSVSLAQLGTLAVNSGLSSIQIVSPTNGAILSSTFPVVLTSPIESGVSYFVRLEYGVGETWNLLGEGSTIPNPYIQWNTRNVANGQYSLRVQLFLPDGSMQQDIKTVVIRNLQVSLSHRILDPFTSDVTVVTVTDGGGMDSSGSLVVSAHAAQTAVNSTWEGFFVDFSPTPVWQQGATFSNGVGVVTWNGKDATGLPVPAGEYVFKVQVNYLGGLSAGYAEQSNPLGLISLINGSFSNVMVGEIRGTNFDPYFGESMDLGFHLDQPAWVTLSYDQNNLIGILKKVLYDEGDSIYWWDGRRYQERGFAYPNGGPIAFYLKGVAVPHSLITLTNQSLTISDFTISPVTIFPSYGQFANIRYSISRDAKISVNIYEVANWGAGNLFRTVMGDLLQDAGQHEFYWDGTDEAGLYPVISGNYCVEIVASDPTANSYQSVQRRQVRIHP